jgi:NAD(P)H-hydrate epimerase
MRALDRWAIDECGVPSVDLMEKAGGCVARVVADSELAGGPARIVCGKGNNGGDGLVAARRLGELGVEVEVLLLFEPGELRGDARESYEKFVASGHEPRAVRAEELPRLLEGSGVLVDALLGTGFTGIPRSPIDVAIRAINGSLARVVAVDVPSGVDASSGEVAGECVRADSTVTFHARKIGLCIHPGKSYAGHVEVVDIGIPPGGPRALGWSPQVGLIRPAVLREVPRRGPNSTKFSSGSVLVVGGSTGLTGAVCMASEAAMRAGAGWVRAAVPASLNLVFEQKLTEVMTVLLADDDGRLSDDAVGGVLDAAARADAVVLGPGLGRTDSAFELARSLVMRIDRPLLVDADGLNALAGHLDLVAARTAPTVLTPHAGELARLLETTSDEVGARRLAHVRDAAERTGATVILKGDDSLVAEAGRVGVSDGGSSALATAGTGDVLSGVIAAFLAKRLPAFEASCAGVYAHAQAGWLAATELGPDSVIATDVIAALPAALRRPSDDAQVR